MRRPNWRGAAIFLAGLVTSGVSLWAWHPPAAGVYVGMILAVLGEGAMKGKR